MCPGLSGLPLLGFSKIAPPPLKAPVVLSRKVLRRGPAFGARALLLTRGPSLSFLTTSTVYSNRLPAGLLHPAHGHGVRHVSGPLSLVARRLALPRAASLPGRARHPRDAPPFEAFPSAEALRRVTATDTLAPLPSVKPRRLCMLPCRDGSPSRASPTSGSCSAAESVAATRCCHPIAARCSLGLGPSRCWTRSGSRLDRSPGGRLESLVVVLLRGSLVVSSSWPKPARVLRPRWVRQDQPKWMLGEARGGVGSRMPAEANLLSRRPVGSGPGRLPKLAALRVARVRMALHVALRRGRPRHCPRCASGWSSGIPYQPESVREAWNDQVPVPFRL